VGRWVDQLPCGGGVVIVVALIVGKLGHEDGIIICGRVCAREALGFLEYLGVYLRYWL
jgi:hypothetical protein